MLKYFFRKKNRYAGVFVDGIACSDEIQYEYRKYLCNYKNKFAAILEGRQLAWLNSFFMCPPGFPTVEVSYSKKYNFKPVKEINSRYRGVRVDFVVGSETNGHASIFLGHINLKIYHCPDHIIVETLRGKEKVRTRKGFFSISIIKINNKKLIWVSGSKEKILFSTWEDEWPFENIDIKNDSNYLGVVGYQSWTNKKSNHHFPPKPNDATVSVVKSSPFWVREWEERSRKLWHISIALRVCTDFYTKNKKTSHSSKELFNYIYALSELIFIALNHFTHWRPSSSIVAKAGEWERGNWASGFLCGAYGVSAGILSDLKILYGPKKRISKAAIEKGGEWLVRDDAVPYTSLDFPPVAHWVRRSTNHGIVILASALVGLEEVHRISQQSQVRSLISKLEAEFWELMNTSFKEGVYLEGIRYAQFSLQEAITYMVYSHRKSSCDWNDFIANKFPVAPLIKHFFNAASYPGSQFPYVSWGDCPILPWKSSVIFFLDSIEGKEFCGNLQEKIFQSRKVVKLHAKESSEILRTEPLTLPTKLLPAAKDNAGIHSPSLKVYSNSVGVVNKKINKSQYADWMLYVISTPIHLTHNKDHDLGSFYWAVKGEVCVGEVPGRAAHAHSSIAVKDSMLEISADSYSCYGSEVDNNFADRNYTGIVKSIDDGYDQYSRLKVEARKGVLFSNGVPLVENYERDFIVIDFKKPVLLLVTRGVAIKRNAFVNYVCPAGASVSGVNFSPFEKRYHLAEKDSTLRVIGNSPSFILSGSEESLMRRVVVDLEGEEFFCSIAVLESSDKKCNIDKKLNEKDEILLQLSEVNGLKFEVNIPQAGKEISLSRID